MGATEYLSHLENYILLAPPLLEKEDMTVPRIKLNKRSDGRYSCRYDNKYFYGKTQAEVLKKRDEYIAFVQSGASQQIDIVTFNDYCQGWVETYHSECNPKTRQQYESSIRYFGEFVADKPIALITTTDVRKVMNSISGKSKSYIHKFAMTIRGVFSSALNDGVIQKNPAANIKPPRGTQGEHRYLEQWERDLVLSTYKGHDFGLCAVTMMLAGLRRGQVLFLDVDRDVDFVNNTITVRGAVSFVNGNQPTASSGKTEAARRTIPMSRMLADALKGHHGLLCTNKEGGMMSEMAFTRKYESYLCYLSTCLNGCQKRWYGRTKEHKAMIQAGKLPEWRDVSIRCHDFRVTFCTMCYNAGVPIKTLQTWMGHADTQMIMNIYTKLDSEKQKQDLDSLNQYFSKSFSA